VEITAHTTPTSEPTSIASTMKPYWKGADRVAAISASAELKPAKNESPAPVAAAPVLAVAPIKAALALKVAPKPAPIPGTLIPRSFWQRRAPGQRVLQPCR